MEISFTNKTVLVTGGGNGIGRAVCKALCKYGANVATICMDGPALVTLAKECPGIRTITLDVTKDWDATRSAVESIGHIDCLVNNAGVAIIAPFVDVTQEEFDKSFNINVKGLFNISQVVAKQMIRQGQGGSIVNLSSQASQAGLMDHAVYCATKSAVDSICRVMALELGKHNIRVNCVNPTVVMTDLGRLVWSDPQKSSRMLSRIPLNRFADEYFHVMKVLITAAVPSLLNCHWTEAYWGKHPENQKELVEQLRYNDHVLSDKVAEVMTQVDRGRYVQNEPYKDFPAGIGFDATISAPHMHAFALEELKDHLKPGNKVLDVGSGSGYLTVCMALMVGRIGKAIGIEHIPELVVYAKENVMKDKPRLLKSGRVKFVAGDGRLGVPEEGPFDAIHVGAAAPELPPALLQQLKPGGRMVIPVGPPGALQHMMVVDKDKNGNITQSLEAGVFYVPLTDKEKQWPRNYKKGSFFQGVFSGERPV